MDHVFTVRRLKGGKFGDEPGKTRFLGVPEASANIHPSHAQAKASWVKSVMEEAMPAPPPDAETLEQAPAIRPGNILLYVHGFNTPTKIMLERHRLLEKGLKKAGYDGVVVSFDWPSASSALNYLEDRSDAKETARKLVDEGIATFAALNRPDCPISLHIVAHSMGAYVLREAFDDADDRPAVAARAWTVSQVMLLSADVSASSLADGNPKSSSLYRHCVRLTNFFNPYDAALSLSGIKRVGVAPRVGRIGLPGNVPNKAVNVDCGPYFHNGRRVFNKLPNGSHTWYFYDQNFMNDLFETIGGESDRNMIATRSGTDSRLVFTG